MINKLPCTYLYIKDTGVGERNHNFFKAINHLRKYKKKANITELYQEALQINKQFQEPLGETEVKTVTLHVFKKNYMSTCQRFKKYCRHCRYGSNRKPFKETIPGLWKILKKDNSLKNGVVGLPHGYKYYLWDILDTSQLKEDDKFRLIFNLRDYQSRNVIQFSNSCSRYKPYNICFMKHFRNLYNLEINKNQIHIDEYLYLKKVKKI